MGSSDAETRGVRVVAQSFYVADRSRPLANEYFFAYTVRIENRGRELVQLVSRHWLIRDAEGREEEVRGPGVVGEQPVLAPGEAFEYTSACPLSTPFGTMRGSYQMITAKGDRFDAEIKPFELSEPRTIH